MEKNIIEVKNLVKKYRISEKKHGIIGYIKHLFYPKYKEQTAVNNISFNVKMRRTCSDTLEKMVQGSLPQ